MLTDRYGIYFKLTGHEDKGHCFWCGAEVKGGRRYCCQEHHELYLETYHWPEASAACLKRYNGSCADCGKEAKWASELRIHHIKPLNGAYRLWNDLNRPDNLIALCPSCHGKRHRTKQSTIEQARGDKQLAMDLT